MNYYNVDLLNIEQVLSVMQMNEALRGTSAAELVERYILDVIKGFTPNLKPPPDAQSNWFTDHRIFGEDTRQQGFGFSSLACLVWSSQQIRI